jgi:predicted ATPase with chaperone activity
MQDACIAAAADQDSRERVRSALKNSGATFPAKRITINLRVTGDVSVGVITP